MRRHRLVALKGIKEEKEEEEEERDVRMITVSLSKCEEEKNNEETG